MDPYERLSMWTRWRPVSQLGTVFNRRRRVTTYQVVSGTGSGFKVEIVDEGARQTVLGFDTEVEALAWIEADQAREMEAKPSDRPNKSGRQPA